MQHAVGIMLLLLTMFYSLNPCRYGPFATDIQLSVPNYTTVRAVKLLVHFENCLLMTI